jgi:hypothetical protein
VASKENIERLKLVVEQLHNCSAVHSASKHVKEVFQGQTAWEGDVEAFDLRGHPKAKRAYGWSYGEPEQFITIRGLPPVNSPESAAKVGVAYQMKKGKQ